MDRLFVFEALLVACLFAGRWPTFHVPWALGFDEAQMIAQAQRCLLVDAVPWRGFDGNSGGPLDSWVLLLPALLGVPIDYLSARVVAVLLWCVTLVATHRTLLQVVASRWARVAMIPFVAFLSLARETEFVHYTSEALPVALISVAIWMLVVRSRGHAVWTVLAGATLGAVPFAKLQAGPIGLVVGVMAMVAIARRPGLGGQLRLAGGALLPAAAIFSTLLLTGSWHHFFRSYIAWGLDYAAQSVPWIRFVELFGRASSFRSFYFHVVLLVSYALVVALLGYRRAGGRNRTGSTRNYLPWTFGSACLYLLIALVVVRTPNRLFDHYLLFVAPPITLLVALGLDSASRFANSTNDGESRRRIVLSVLCAVGLLLQIAAVPRSGSAVEHRRQQRLETPHRVAAPAEALLFITQPEEALLVWGWQPGLYVESKLVPATRDAITYNQIEPLENRPYFRQRFLRDLDESLPPVMVDTVGRGSYRFGDPADGISSFPELAERVARDYVSLPHWLGREPSPEMPLIYVHRSRLRELESGAFGPSQTVRERLAEILDAAVRRDELKRGHGSS